MDIVPLRIQQDGLLCLDVEICHHKKALSIPAQFIVDTAAQRTFVVPHWQRRIEQETGSITFAGPATTAQTLIGSLGFRLSKEIELKALCCGGTKVTLNTNGWAQFGHIDWWSRVVGGMAINIRDNLLGMDILSDRWTLYHNHQGASFLVSRPHPLDGVLEKVPDLDPYFHPNRNDDIPPINWLD